MDNDYEDEQESTPRRRPKRKAAKAATPNKKAKVEEGVGEFNEFFMPPVESTLLLVELLHSIHFNLTLRANKSATLRLSAQILPPVL